MTFDLSNGIFGPRASPGASFDQWGDGMAGGLDRAAENMLRGIELAGFGPSGFALGAMPNLGALDAGNFRGRSIGAPGGGFAAIFGQMQRYADMLVQSVGTMPDFMTGFMRVFFGDPAAGAAAGGPAEAATSSAAPARASRRHSAEDADEADDADEGDGTKRPDTTTTPGPTGPGHTGPTAPTPPTPTMSDADKTAWTAAADKALAPLRGKVPATLFDISYDPSVKRITIQRKEGSPLVEYSETIPVVKALKAAIGHLAKTPELKGAHIHVKPDKNVHVPVEADLGTKLDPVTKEVYEALQKAPLPPPADPAKWEQELKDAIGKTEWLKTVVKTPTYDPATRSATLELALSDDNIPTELNLIRLALRSLEKDLIALDENARLQGNILQIKHGDKVVAFSLDGTLKKQTVEIWKALTGKELPAALLSPTSTAPRPDAAPDGAAAAPATVRPTATTPQARYEAAFKTAAPHLRHAIREPQWDPRTRTATIVRMTPGLTRMPRRVPDETRNTLKAELTALAANPLTRGTTILVGPKRTPFKVDRQLPTKLDAFRSALRMHSPSDVPADVPAAITWKAKMDVARSRLATLIDTPRYYWGPVVAPEPPFTATTLQLRDGLTSMTPDAERTHKANVQAALTMLKGFQETKTTYLVIGPDEARIKAADATVDNVWAALTAGLARRAAGPTGPSAVAPRLAGRDPELAARRVSAGVADTVAAHPQPPRTVPADSHSAAAAPTTAPRRVVPTRLAAPRPVRPEAGPARSIRPDRAAKVEYAVDPHPVKPVRHIAPAPAPAWPRPDPKAIDRALVTLAFAPASVFFQLQYDDAKREVHVSLQPGMTTVALQPLEANLKIGLQRLVGQNITVVVGTNPSGISLKDAAAVDALWQQLCPSAAPAATAVLAPRPAVAVEPAPTRGSAPVVADKPALGLDARPAAEEPAPVPAPIVRPRSAPKVFDREDVQRAFYFVSDVLKWPTTIDDTQRRVLLELKPGTTRADLVKQQTNFENVLQSLLGQDIAIVVRDEHTHILMEDPSSISAVWESLVLSIDDAVAARPSAEATDHPVPTAGEPGTRSAVAHTAAPSGSPFGTVAPLSGSRPIPARTESSGAIARALGAAPPETARPVVLAPAQAWERAVGIAFRNLDLPPFTIEKFDHTNQHRVTVALAPGQKIPDYGEERRVLRRQLHANLKSLARHPEGLPVTLVCKNGTSQSTIVITARTVAQPDWETNVVDQLIEAFSDE